MSVVVNATEAQAEKAIAVLKRAIDAAENSNQAGENFVVGAANWDATRDALIEAPATQAEVEAAVKSFNGGLVRKDDLQNPRGYTIFYLPEAAMREALNAFVRGRAA